MTAKDLDETLKTIAANAKAMRDAGVVGRVIANGVEFELEAPEPPAAPPTHPTESAPEVSPLDDAVTYGTTEVPKRRKPFDHDATRAEFERE